jgi:5'-nucleotidase
MRVLLTNDDGIESAGLAALEAALRPACELWVVAPDREQSAASHAISLSRPLRIHAAGERRFAVDGTPTDCVYLALNHLMKEHPPDAVFSGINHGPNLAEDVLYSGTVAGAMEGTILGIRFCVAISVVPVKRRFAFDAAAAFGRALLDGAPENSQAGSTASPILLNVNVPTDAVPDTFRVTRLGRRGYFAFVEERKDPRGRLYYWIGGPEREHDDIPGSDCNAVFDDRVTSVTPLQIDLTSAKGAGQLENWTLPGFKRS